MLIASLAAFAYPKARAWMFRKSSVPFERTLTNSPPLILWAWERPADLRFIDPRKVGVAFLAKSILLHADAVAIRPRLQPLQLPEGTKVIAVARIETARDRKPALSVSQRDRTVQSIVEMASLPGVSEIQIDFDATQSERSFYRELIANLKQRLPANTRLSITALASWCMSDDWLTDLPIDEAVPMLFRMSSDAKQIVNRLEAGDDFNAAPCRQSYGISLDEQRPKLLPARRLFVFNPDAWTEKSLREIPESVQ
ncbi:MAG: DUF3142 domain-containing protein [Pyrinomonadaceae bacterium]